jgi:hypothetical protein
MALPWFAFGVSDDGLTQTACECQHFAAGARAAGFAPARVGIVGHLQPMVLLPGPEGSPPGTFRCQFPGDLPTLPAVDGAGHATMPQD